jgi:hypothetical protein
MAGVTHQLSDGWMMKDYGAQAAAMSQVSKYESSFGLF